MEYKASSAFLNRKKQFLEKLEEAKDMGLVDEDIIDLLDIINSLPFAYTTSSCSGRIMLIDIPPSEKKYESFRLAKWHSPISFEEFWETIRGYRPFGTLWLKVDSFIVAFAVDRIEWASFFLKLSRLIGLKYSGVRSIQSSFDHVMMDVMSTEHVHLPISDKNNGLLITEDYARYIHKIAIKKLKKTKDKLNRFKKTMLIVKELFQEGRLDPTKPDFKSILNYLNH